MNSQSNPLIRNALPRGAGYANRRQMLCNAGAGFGSIVLSSMLGSSIMSNAQGASEVTSGAKASHHPARAKSVIFVFLEGGPSHIDLFDPKPAIERFAGQPLPESFGRIITPMGEYNAPMMPSKRQWQQHGQSGLWVSDWLPNIAKHADDLCVIRSCWGNGLNHSNGVCQMNSGSILGGRPSLGSWITYGLGSENENLPSFVVIEDGDGHVINGPRNWSSGFMPATYQGTAIQGGDEPIAYLKNPKGVSVETQSAKLRLLNDLNRSHLQGRESESEMEARIRSFELAFRMQSEAPIAIDMSDETQATKELYGIDQSVTESFGKKCLLARRLVERGVRFVQLYHGAGSKWDAHSGIEKNHSSLCKASDMPVAGLLADLKQRGLLDSTLVIWGGEFGRTPMSEKGDGRDHNPNGFTMWMAGGGVRAGCTVGATDEIGLHAVEDRLHVHDLHATILHLMGLDPVKLVYHHQGRPERITQNEGSVCKKIIA